MVAIVQLTSTYCLPAMVLTGVACLYGAPRIAVAAPAPEPWPSGSQSSIAKAGSAPDGSGAIVMPLPRRSGFFANRSRPAAAEEDCVRRDSAEGGFPELTPEEQTSAGLTVSGSLVVAGGSLAVDSAVFHEILERAGGRASARIVFFPTNSNAYPIEDGGVAAFETFLSTSMWRDLPNPVVLRHTYNPLEADNVLFWQVIDSATGVFFAGGRSSRSYRAYFNTQTHAAIDRLLARGGVFAGTSAGALMQSNVMLRSDLSGDNTIMLGDLREGFALGGMQNMVFDVHNLERNRAYDPVEVITAYPELLGLSVDEDTAFTLIGNELRVIGAGYVAVYDRTLWQDVNYCANFQLYAPNQSRPLIPSQGKFFFLRANDRYNVRSRLVAAAAGSRDWQEN